MASFWKHVKEVLEKSDVVLEVLDARLIEQSRNREIEEKVQKLGKKLLFVINKSDLVDPSALLDVKKTLKPSVFVSSREKLGTTILKKKIMELSKGEMVIVGVVGYPNVGKSSVINALSGRNAARTSAESGFTKGMQKVRVGPKIVLLDTPGVLPEREKDEFKHGMIGAVDFAKLKDPEGVALSFIEERKELVRRHYGITSEDAEEILEAIAFKFKKLRKRGEADLESAARFLLKEWQAGKIKNV
jgi:ribosome biogenesis GTPase A